MLEAWSRTRDGTRKLSANFTVAEFACKDGSDPVFVDSSLAALLQKMARTLCSWTAALPPCCRRSATTSAAP